MELVIIAQIFMQLQQLALLLLENKNASVLHIATRKLRATRRFLHRVRRTSVGLQQRLARQLTVQKARGSVDINPDLLYDRTGLFEDEFEAIFQQIRPTIARCRLSRNSKPVPTVLTLRARLEMVIFWLRHYPTYTVLRERYPVSRSTFSRDIRHILPAIYVAVRSISWPARWTPTEFSSVSAAIDCTAHLRWRVHPRQGDWYRGDKHAHFMLAQVVCSVFGEIYNVKLAQGHNSDQGMLLSTNLTEFLEDNSLWWLADQGYKHHRLVTPDANRSYRWNEKQKNLRSVVETVIGLVKTWNVAALKFRQIPELQEIALMVAYNITNTTLRQFPLRMYVEF